MNAEEFWHYFETYVIKKINPPDVCHFLDYITDIKKEALGLKRKLKIYKKGVDLIEDKIIQMPEDDYRFLLTIIDKHIKQKLKKEGNKK